MSDGKMTYEDWLRGCVHHDGRHGYVTLPCDEVLKIADFIERLRADHNCSENPTSSEIPNNCEMSCEECGHWEHGAGQHYYCALLEMGQECYFESKYESTLMFANEPKTEPQQCYLRKSCDHYGDKQVCGRCREYNLYSHIVGKHADVIIIDEPQTDVEIARAIVHKAIDDAVIAEDAYPDLRQKMHDAVDSYEPQIVACPIQEEDADYARWLYEDEPQTDCHWK